MALLTLPTFEFAPVEERIKNFKLREFIADNGKYLLLLTLLCLVVYLFSLGNDFTSDDIDGIVKNHLISDFSYTFRHFPPTIQAPLYFVTHSLFGNSPLAFRVINNLSFHLLSVLAGFIFIYLLHGNRVAFYASALFAVHPVLVESVAWISGNSYPRYSFFILLGLSLYILSWRHKKYLKYAIASFCLSLFSSEKSVIFPLLIILLHIMYHQPFTFIKKYALLGLLPIGLAAYFLLTLPSRLAFLKDTYFQDQYLRNPFLQIPTSVITYLELIFYPVNLSHYHSEVLHFDIIYILRLLLFVSLIILLFVSFKKRLAIFLWMSFFLITLSPTLTPFVASWLVAERYVYLPSLGVFVIIGLLINQLTQNKRVSLYGQVAFGVIICLLAVRTIIRTLDWSNEYSLWAATVRTNPNHPQARYNLGYQKFLSGDLNGARIEFETAIALNPSYVNPYHALGNVYLKSNDIPQAAVYYEKAIQINPKFWYSHYSLAEVFFNQGEYDMAINHLKDAISINPNNAPLYASLGVTYLTLSDSENARKYFLKALELDPTNNQAKEGILKLSSISR